MKDRTESEHERRDAVLAGNLMKPPSAMSNVRTRTDRRCQ